MTGMEGPGSASRTEESIRSEIAQKEAELSEVTERLHLIKSNIGKWQIDSIKLEAGDVDEATKKREKDEQETADERAERRLLGELKELNPLKY